MGRGVAGGGDRQARVHARRGAVGLGADGQRQLELDGHLPQVRVSQLVAVESGGVHALEPVQLPAGLLHGEDAAVHLVLAFDLQPLVVLVFEEIGGQQPGQPLRRPARRLSRAPESGAAGSRRVSAGRLRSCLWRFALGVGPGQPHQRVGRRLAVEFNVHAAVLAVFGARARWE